MAASVCSYAAPSYSYEQRQNIGASDDHHPQDSFSMPKIHGDVFLFSPSLCSRLSQESTSQSSSSFDPLSYICSPADNNSLVRISSPSALISSASPGSPAPANGLFAACDTKPLTRLSPGTPFERLFDSSPGGFWHADDVFISPISRGSAILGNLQYGSDEDAEGEDDDEGEAPIPGKIESLLAYGKSHGLSDSPRTVRSPSSLSSLSSRSSSPSVALSALRLPSSQTSRSATMLCSPSAKAASTSPLASPVKSCTQSPPAPVDAHFVRRSRRLRSTTRYNGRVLGTEILNQQAQARDASAGEYETSPLKLSSSPASSLCDSDDENYVPADRPTRRTRKRARQSRQSSPSLRTKKRRISEPTAVPEAVRVRVSSQSSSPDDTDAAYSNRTFPLSLPIHENFPLFYRRFPVSSVIDAELAATYGIRVPSVGDGTPNPPRDALDLYTPRFVKGRGTSKVGLCPICHESVKRGGEGKKLWLSMKFSAFKCYHMQYAHGISPATGLPFSPPLGFRIMPRPNAGKLEKTQIMEGKCHKCKKWVAIEGIKDVPTKVKEIFWWKHAAACHQGSTVEGECDVFVEDVVYEAVCSVEDADGETDVEE